MSSFEKSASGHNEMSNNVLSSLFIVYQRFQIALLLSASPLL